MQDSRGFLWLGTDMGLSRFNGFNFKNYSVDEGLPDNEVFQVLEDSEGRFWLGTLNGIIAYFEASGKTTTIEYEHDGKGPSRIIRSLQELSDGSVAIARTGGPVTVVKDDQVVGVYDIPVHLVWEYNNRLVGASSSYLIDLATGDTIKTFSFSSNNFPIRGAHKAGTTVLAEGLNVIVLDGIEERLQLTLNKEHREVIGVYLGQEQAWIGTRNGVVAISLTTGQVLGKHLLGRQVTGAVRDHEGNYWFSTLSSGLYQWPGSGIKKLVLDKDNPSRRINAIWLDEGQNMWFGHDKNCYSIRSPDGRSKQYTFKSKVIDNVRGFKRQGNNVFVVSKAKTFAHGKDGPAFNVFMNDLGFLKDQVYLLGADIIRLSVDSLYALKGKHMEQAAQLSRMRDNALVIKDRGISTCSVADSQLYLGTINGLFSVVGGAKPTPVLPEVINSTVSRICTLSNSQQLCVATTANGLLLLNGAKYTRIGLGSGVPSNNCQAVYPGPKNELWACFDNQLYWIGEQEKGWKVKNYSSLLGLEDQRIRSIAMKGDTVYLGTDYGLLYFNKNQKSNSGNIPMFLDSVLVNGRAVDVSQPIELPSRYNSLEAFYTALNYTSSWETSYSYRIEGLDTAESKTQSRNLIFRSLPYGTYSLHVSATTSDGATAKLAPIEFTVRTPLHAQVWFWPLIVFLGLATISIVILLRFRSLRRRHRFETQRLETEKQKNLIEKQLAELQEKALRMQMNPHFVFNALNTIKGFYAEDRGVEADNYIVRFSKLLRVILETQGSEISLEQEIRSLTLYLELLQIRYNHKFDFSFKVAPDVPTEEIEIPSMMLQPFVENAVIHGLAPKQGKGHLEVRFSVLQDRLKVCIEDNGVGRGYFKNRPVEDHESVATGITEERLRLFNQLNAASATLSITDLKQAGEPSGTLVELLIDIAHEWE